MGTGPQNRPGEPLVMLQGVGLTREQLVSAASSLRQPIRRSPLTSRRKAISLVPVRVLPVGQASVEGDALAERIGALEALEPSPDDGQ